MSRAESYGRLVLRRWLTPRAQRAALVATLLLVFTAVFADLLAAEKPLLARFQGELYVLPNLFEPAALRVYDNRLLQQAMAPGDWALLPPIPWGYNNHDLSAVLQGPSAAHWLGTDATGRDVASRLIHGSRISLAVGFLAVSFLVTLGVLLGSLAGYFGGWIDALVNRVIEVLNSVPTLLLLVTTLAILAPDGWAAVLAMMVVIGLVGWTTVARLVRGEILRVRSLDYVEASRALGCSTWQVLLRHVLPNSMGPVLVAATFSMASAILMEGSLSFLGYGIPADMASWGGLLNQVRGNVEAWWLALFPGAAIFITVLSFNLAGEGLRDAVDPRLFGSR